MKNRRAGHAMIELAACAAVMLACVAGTFGFGYTFYVYNQLVTAVGNGARYAAGVEHSDASDTAVRNMVVYGVPQPEAADRPVVSGLTAENVDIQWMLDHGAPAAVDVSIRNFSIDALFAKFTFNARPGVEFPYIGPAAPAQPAETKK